MHEHTKVRLHEDNNNVALIMPTETKNLRGIVDLFRDYTTVGTKIIKNIHE